MQKELALKIIKRFNNQIYSEYFKRLLLFDKKDSPNAQLLTVKDIDDSLPTNSQMFEFCQMDEISALYREISWLFIPHIFPIDLFEDISSINIISQDFLKELKILNKVYPPVGTNKDQFESHIYFLTNFADLSEDDYVHKIMPKYKLLMRKAGFNSTTLTKPFCDIITPDSIIESPENSIPCLESFLTNYPYEISFKWNENDELTLEYFASERYFPSLMKYNKSPLHPNYTLVRQNSIINDFVELLNSTPTEKNLEEYLKLYYRDIFGYEFDQIETQLWLKLPEDVYKKKGMRLDIFLHNCVEQDWELFELKKTITANPTYPTK